MLPLQGPAIPAIFRVKFGLTLNDFVHLLQVPLSLNSD